MQMINSQALYYSLTYVWVKGKSEVCPTVTGC